MDQRPNPDQLLRRVQAEEQQAQRGKLKLFFGANAGVGKTYAMLEAARQRKKECIDVVVGIVETHGRAETAMLLEGLEILPRKTMTYKGVQLDEFDLDGALARKPALILVDELAHTNAPGSRHAKRWQDVEELLDAGISVYTTLNVQHWESLNDVVAQITGIQVRETVPDTFLERAHELELIDLPPEELLTRLKEGKVYRGEHADRAAENFFQPGNLIVLRELALRHAAERVDAQMQAFKQEHAIQDVWQVSDRILVGISSSPLSVRLVRATARLANRLHAEWIVAHVETPATLRVTKEERQRVVQTLRLAEELGAQTVTLNGQNVTDEILNYARARNVTKIVLGKPTRPRWKEWFQGSIVNELARRAGDIDLYVISGKGTSLRTRRGPVLPESTPWQQLLAGTFVVGLCTLLCGALFKRFDRANLIMIYLLGLLWVAYRYGRKSALLASVLSVLCFVFFFVPPYLSFSISDTQYLLTFVVMLVVGIFISTITGRLKSQAEALRRRQLRTEALYRLSRTMSEIPNPRQLLVAGWQQLEDFYGMPVLILLPKENSLEPAAGDPEKFGFNTHEQATAQWVYDHAQPAGAGTDTLAGSTGLYLPLKGIRTTQGVLALRPAPDTPLDPEQFQLLETFASEVGGALESTQLSEEAGRAEAETETERLRNLILRSFSIDLEKPLSEIAQDAAVLLGSRDSFSGPTLEVLLKIHNQALELQRLASDLPKHLGSQPGADGEPSVQTNKPALPQATSEKVSNILTPAQVVIFQGKPSKKEILSRLIQILHVPNSDQALKAILEREKAASTVIGPGLAIPHARLEGLTEIKAALGVIASPDGLQDTIRLWLLFLSPSENMREHLVFLAAVSALFQTPGLTDNLINLKNPQEIIAKIRAVEEPNEAKT